MPLMFLSLFDGQIHCYDTWIANCYRLYHFQGAKTWNYLLILVTGSTSSFKFKKKKVIEVSIRKMLCTIHQIKIYRVDSLSPSSNNQCQVFSWRSLSLIILLNGKNVTLEVTKKWWWWWWWRKGPLFKRGLVTILLK